MTLCPRCRQPVEETDCYCRFCGRALQPRMGFWYGNGGILLLALIVGPFALITVWMSRKLSTTAKWAWTAGIGLMSYYIAYSLYHTFLLLQEAFSSIPAGF